MIFGRAPWLESHDEFSGVGAHELNPRYSHVDGGWFRNRWDGRRDLATLEVPQLFLARALVAGAIPIRLDGHDGAHYQFDHAPVDWTGLARACWWLAWKATQSTSYVDPTYDVVVAEAHRFAMFFAYHWLSSTTAPATQALHYLEATEAPGRPPGTMLDAEEHGITVDKCLEWCETVEAERRRPSAIYSGAYVAGGTIWQSTALRTSKYGPRPMHLAAYTTEAKALKLPGVAAYPWDAWQFSSNGPVPGITGRADMNRIDTRPAYALACGLTFPPPLPEPEIDDMQIRLLILTDSDAQFLAETTSDGRALSCRWADGSQKMQSVVAAHRAAAVGKQATFEQSGDIKGLSNVALLGQLPVGDSRHTWSGQEFSAFDGGGTVDLVARDAFERQDVLIVKLNDAVGRSGQLIGDIQKGLGEAAEARA